MITRITRGTVAANAEGRVFEVLRVAAQSRPSAPGLVSMSLNRRVTPRGVELVAVTVWEDAASMAAVLGPDWQAPSWLPGLGDSIIDATVEMYETVAASAAALAELQGVG